MMLLTGLRSNNLQGYLAALGVVRLIPDARLGWDFDEGCAYLENVENPVAALAKTLEAKNPYRRLMWLTQKTEAKQERKDLEKQLNALKQRPGATDDPALKAEILSLQARINAIKNRHAAEAFTLHQQAKAPPDWGQHAEDTRWARALFTPQGESTRLDMMWQGNRPEGLMGNLAESRGIVCASPTAKLEETLFGPWRYEDKAVGSLYLEFESIGYAARHRGTKSPADSKSRAVAGAQWLAGEGLLIMGAVEEDTLCLPLWRRAEPLAVVCERLKHKVGEQWLEAVTERLPGKNGKFYWTARTLSDAKNPAGSRKKNQQKNKDLYNGTELWMV